MCVDNFDQKRLKNDVKSFKKPDTFYNNVHVGSYVLKPNFG